MTDYDALFKMKVSYEWLVEHVDEYDDIQDHDRADKLTEKQFEDALHGALFGEEVYTGLKPRLALVRDRGSEADGLEHRSYAYAVKNGNGDWVLPNETDSGHKVPERYQNQLLKAQGITKAIEKQ